MNSDTLIRQIAEADVFGPEHDLPESARTSAVALTEIRRRIDIMDAKELTKPVEQESRSKSGWLVAAATFGAIVLIAGLVVVLTNRQAVEPADEVVPTTQALPTTTQAVAVATTLPPAPVLEDLLPLVFAYEAAINSGDVDQILSVWGDDFVFVDIDNPAYRPSAERWALENAFMAWTGTRITFEECDIADGGVRCVAAMHGPIEDAASLGTAFASVKLAFDEGKIVSESVSVIDGRVSYGDSREAFIALVAEVDEEAAAKFGRMNHPIDKTLENAALWTTWAERLLGES